MGNKFICRLLGFALLFSGPCFSQYTKYWIQFTDKKGTPYFISKPIEFLSQRAINRRANQGISYAENDLPITPRYVDSVRKVSGVTVLNRSKWFNAITIYTEDTNALKTIKAFSFVKKSEPVRRLCRNAEDVEYRNQNTKRVSKYPFVNTMKLRGGDSEWTLNAQGDYSPEISSSYSYGPSFNQVNMLGGVCMHNMGFDGKGIQIAILDVGFDRVDSAAAFDSLLANKQILGRRNFVDQNTNVTIPGEVHGTWCLSLMAGNIPGQLIGTAPKAGYWLLRTEDGASENVIEEDNWVSGAEFADSVGADVLSTSLGYTEFDSVKINNILVANPANHTYANMDGNTTRISIGTDIAASKGMFPVCSAGNMGGSPWHFIGAPADAYNVLAVGAVDSMRRYVGFSSTGPSFDKRIKPNVAAQGDHPYTTDLAGGTYNSFSGTSFACPLTAGMVACLWQANPTFTNTQLFNAIQKTASQHSNPDSLLGYGIPDFCAAHDSLSSVHENVLAGDILIYPNPSHGITEVKCGKLKVNSVEIRNVIGECVYRSLIFASKFPIDLSFHSKGIYFVRLNFTNGNIVKKLVIE